IWEGSAAAAWTAGVFPGCPTVSGMVSGSLMNDMPHRPIERLARRDRPCSPATVTLVESHVHDHVGMTSTGIGCREMLGGSLPCAAKHVLFLRNLGHSERLQGGQSFVHDLL